MSQVAAIQMASGPQVSANLTEAARLIARAAQSGARLVVLPENFAIMPVKESERLAAAEAEGQGPIQNFLVQQARTHGIWLVAGTIPLRTQSGERVRSACIVYDDRGARVARYDKIHLFDVRLESGEQYNESAAFEPGADTVVCDSPFGRIGLAICYDLRFPELFRRLLDAGAEIFAVPSAFTARTGRAHWEILVRTRAVENLCYVIAAAQGGYHLNGRETWGDSMIVNPWGEVLDRLPRGSGVVAANLDLRLQARMRGSFPSIQHRRLRA